MSDDKGFKVTDHRAASEESPESTDNSQPGCGCAGANDQQHAAQAADKAQAASGQNIYPQVTFTTFVLSLSSSAMVHLGEVPEPESGQTRQDLPLAKHTIDILAMLKDKTSKCLDEEESRLLEGVLYELRMIYVMKTQ